MKITTTLVIQKVMKMLLRVQALNTSITSIQGILNSVLAAILNLSITLMNQVVLRGVIRMYIEVIGLLMDGRLLTNVLTVAIFGNIVCLNSFLLLHT